MHLKCKPEKNAHRTRWPHQMLTDTWTNVKCIYVPCAYNSYMALEPNHIYKLHTTNKATVDLKKIKSI